MFAVRTIGADSSSQGQDCVLFAELGTYLYEYKALAVARCARCTGGRLPAASEAWRTDAECIQGYPFLGCFRREKRARGRVRRTETSLFGSQCTSEYYSTRKCTVTGPFPGQKNPT